MYRSQLVCFIRSKSSRFTIMIHDLARIIWLLRTGSFCPVKFLGSVEKKNYSVKSFFQQANVNNGCRFLIFSSFDRECTIKNECTISFLKLVGILRKFSPDFPFCDGSIEMKSNGLDFFATISGQFSVDFRAIVWSFVILSVRTSVKFLAKMWSVWNPKWNSFDTCTSDEHVNVAKLMYIWTRRRLLRNADLQLTSSGIPRVSWVWHVCWKFPHAGKIYMEAVDFGSDSVEKPGKNWEKNPCSMFQAGVENLVPKLIRVRIHIYFIIIQCTLENWRRFQHFFYKTCKVKFK